MEKDFECHLALPGWVMTTSLAVVSVLIEIGIFWHYPPPPARFADNPIAGGRGRETRYQAERRRGIAPRSLAMIDPHPALCTAAIAPGGAGPEQFRPRAQFPAVNRSRIQQSVRCRHSKPRELSKQCVRLQSFDTTNLPSR